MSNEQKLREALQAYQDANEMSPYGDYSKIEWESSAGPVNPSWHGGDCKKHGRWYGRCYSCSDEWNNLRKLADRDAYTARENALNAAKQLARQALATTEPEFNQEPFIGDPVLVVEREPDYWDRGHFHEGTKPYIKCTKIWGVPIGTKLYTEDQMKSHGEKCLKAGYKHSINN